jgi:hypothetical protein
MHKQYVVTLKREEREQLLGLLKKGKVSARKLCRTQILLQADEGYPDISKLSSEAWVHGAEGLTTTVTSLHYAYRELRR